MHRLIEKIIVVVVVVGFVLPAVSAIPQAHSAPPSNRIKIQYVPPVDPTYRPIYEFLKDRHVLEKFRDFLSIFRLPSHLTIEVLDCQGVVDARYHNDTRHVSVCYEFIADILRRAPKEKLLLE
jgi:hypothetical protein